LFAAVLAGASTACAEPAFQFMRIGEVQPRGWLQEQICMDVTNGYGPHLDKLTTRIATQNFDSRNKSELVKPKIGADWWDGETTGNWFDGFVRAAYLSGDAAARRRADELVAQFLAMQDEDGYLGIYPRAQRFASPIGVQNGEFWTQACLFRGLLAYYEMTGREDVLNAVQRATKLMISKYGANRPYWRETIGGGGPGHNIMFVDVCEWLHRLTGEAGYVAFAKFLYDGYCVPTEVRDADVQLRNLGDLNKPFMGHGAHVMEHIRVPLFVAAATGEARYRAAADNFFPKTARHLTAGGACISDESVRGRPGAPDIGCEYCTMLELLHALQSAVEKSGRAPLADAIEVLAFNAAEGARQRDGRAIQYCSSDNQFAITATAMGRRMKLSPTHEDVAVCCPVTALKFFPYFVNELWMKTAAGDGLVAVNYAPNELTTKLKGVGVRIETDTTYPFEDEVRMVVTPEKPLTCSLRLRVPGWAGGMSVAAPGASVTEANGWRVLTKEWRAGDHISITFQPEVQRKALAGGEVYWQRGPLVYALPLQGDRKQIKSYPLAGFGDYELAPQAGAFWNYAADEKISSFQFARVAATGNPWSNPPLRLAGKLVNGKSGKSEAVELVPMGASLLRRVAFPDAAVMRAVAAQAGLLKGEQNLARRAQATASSVSKGYSAQAAVDGVAEGFPDNLAAEWASAREKEGAKIKLTWDKPVTVGCVWLFDRPNVADHVVAAQLKFSDGSTLEAGEPANDGKTPLKLNFPARSISSLEITITKVSDKTKSAGFAEIAVFEKEPQP
jgi:DUF1680 family protein/type II secretory pathway pseudopilin PulG